MARRRSLKNDFLFTAFILFQAMVRILPESAGRWLGRGIGLLAYGLLPGRRRIALDNIKNALGLEGGEARALAKASFVSLCLVGVEALFFYKRTKLFMQRVACRGVENLEAALARGNGALIVSAHLGNWELMGRMIAALGYRFHIIVQIQAGGGFNAVVNRLRLDAGLMSVARGGNLREIVRALRQGGVVGLLADQDAHREGAFVPFFGQSASTPRGAARIAAMTGAPLVPTYLCRTAPGRYELNFSPCVPLVKTGNGRADLTENLTRVNKALEGMIRQYPGQWLWMHKRWKTKPRGEDYEL